MPYFRKRKVFWNGIYFWKLELTNKFLVNMLLQANEFYLVFIYFVP